MNSLTLILIFTSFSALITSKVEAKGENCLNPNIDAITSLKNGSVFVSSNQFYWILSNKTLDTVSKGLVKHFVPGINSVKMAVSLRHSPTGQSNEILFFQTVSHLID